MPPLPPQDAAAWGMALGINAVLIALAQRAPLLTPAGWVHAGILGTLLWGSVGWRVQPQSDSTAVCQAMCPFGVF